MQKTIVEAYPQIDISITIVWVNILKADSEDAAKKSAEIFSDPRVRQFHDPNRRVAQLVALDTGMPALLTILDDLRVTRERLEETFNRDFVAGPPAAFDAFLFYERGGVWTSRPPQPVDWMTQLDPDAFVGIQKERFHWGKDLIEHLAKAMEKITGQKAAASQPVDRAALTPIQFGWERRMDLAATLFPARREQRKSD